MRQFGSIREYAEAVRRRYLGVSKKEKGKILDGFTKVTGCHRKAAIRLFCRGNQSRVNKKRGRPQQYDAGLLPLAQVYVFPDKFQVKHGILLMRWFIYLTPCFPLSFKGEGDLVV